MIVGGADRRRAHRGARSGAPPADYSQLRQLEPALVGLATLALIVVALWIRHAPSYFLFQTGDMGGYVNGANILLVKGGTSFGRQPQGFTLFLRETNLLLGRANTVAGLPALGAIAPARRRRVRPHAEAARRGRARVRVPRRRCTR